MSFAVQLYNTNSPTNQLTKNLSALGAFSGSLKEGSSIVNPVIMLKGSLPSQANYMYISQFNRYYYITDVTSEYGDIYNVFGHTDVLMSFSESIGSAPCVVGRNENMRQNDLIDPEMYFTADSLYSIQTFATNPLISLVGQNYVILLQGAGA